MLAKKYQSQSNAIVSYDHEDIASGLGVVNFYAGVSVMSGNTTHFLTDDATTISGLTSEKTQAMSGAGDTFDYETVFNTPRIMKGAFRISFSVGVNVAGNIFLKVSLYKVSGADVTQIGSTVESDKFSHSGAGKESVQKNLTITAADRVHFKIGDTLRLRVIMYGSVATPPNAVGFGCDPADRDDVVTGTISTVIEAGELTQFKVGVPFIID